MRETNAHTHTSLHTCRMCEVTSTRRNCGVVKIYFRHGRRCRSRKWPHLLAMARRFYYAVTQLLRLMDIFRSRSRPRVPFYPFFTRVPRHWNTRDGREREREIRKRGETRVSGATRARVCGVKIYFHESLLVDQPRVLGWGAGLYRVSARSVPFQLFPIEPPVSVANYKYIPGIDRPEAGR